MTQLDNKSREQSWINNKFILFNKKIMNYWRTRMHVHTENKPIETEQIEIKCGIFQGHHCCRALA
jgi:hypothetical protein